MITEQNILSYKSEKSKSNKTSGRRSKYLDKTSIQLYENPTFKNYQYKAPEWHGIFETIKPKRTSSDNFELTINESKELLTLVENWDEQGAKKPDSGAYKVAINFLRLFADEIFRKNRVFLLSPYIDVMPDGSIYLHWDLNHTKFLIIFKRKEGIHYFYGEKNGIPFKGGIDMSQPIEEYSHLMDWMKNNLTQHESPII
jgi:hypothetical protein